MKIEKKKAPIRIGLYFVYIICLVTLVTLLNHISSLGVTSYNDNAAELGGTKISRRPFVSVIIPVYNSEKFIRRCIKSLLYQTLTQIEFIFVDDCGTDKSVEIIREYMASDPRIKLLRNSRNMGAGESRNAGMSVASGLYLGTVDPDDWISKDFYDALFKAASQGNYDIAKSLLYIKKRGKYKLYKLNNKMKRGLAAGAKIFEVFHFQQTTAIYRKAIFDAHPLARYGNTSTSEDATFLTKFSFYAKNITFTDNGRYYYERFSDSLSNSKPTAAIAQAELDAANQRLDFLVSNAAPGSYKVFLNLTQKKLTEKYKTFLTIENEIPSKEFMKVKSRFTNTFNKITNLSKL